jgi:hypothetical protein
MAKKKKHTQPKAFGRLSGVASGGVGWNRRCWEGRALVYNNRNGKMYFDHDGGCCSIHPRLYRRDSDYRPFPAHARKILDYHNNTGVWPWEIT